MSFFFLCSSEEALEGPQSRQHSICLQRWGRARQTNSTREARGREMNSCVNGDTREGPTAGGDFAAEDPDLLQTREPAEKRLPQSDDANGSDYPRSRLSSNSSKGILRGREHTALRHSPSQSTARKGDSGGDSSGGFGQPPGTQQPTNVVLLLAYSE